MTTREDRNALRQMVRRGEIVAVYDDGDQQLVDVLGLEGELFRKVYRVQIFGEASNPPVGSTGILLFMSGFPNQALFIAGEDTRYRPRNLATGDKAIYDNHGNEISLLGPTSDETGTRTRVNTVHLQLLGALLEIFVGSVLVTGLPPADPHVADKLWNDGGTVKISAG